MTIMLPLTEKARRLRRIRNEASPWPRLLSLMGLALLFVGLLAAAVFWVPVFYAN